MNSLLKRARNMFGDGHADEQVISLYQRYIRSKVSSASCAANGAKGYAATVKAGKGDIASQKAADWRYDHPSDLELIIINILTQLDLPVDRQYREVKIGRFYVDFKYGDIVIEVNDDTWHDNNSSFKGDVEARDHSKYQYLREQGITVIILAEAAVRNGDAKQLLMQTKASLVNQLHNIW